MRTRKVMVPWKLRLGVPALLLALLLPPAAWSKGNPDAKPGKASAPRYEIIVETDQKIPMLDGAVIMADVHRPKAEGKFPALVEGTPYGKKPSSEMGKGTHAYFAPRGYAVVSWEIRGRYTSEGVFTPFAHDRNDGYDVVEWVAKQPWCNGKVGLIGISYMGQVQLNTAIAQPPHLVCATPAMTAADMWREWFYRGGAMEYMFSAGWASMRLGEELARRGLSPEAFADWKKKLEAVNADKAKAFLTVPAVAFDLAQMGQRNLFRDWASHPTDGQYWRDISPETHFSEIAVPMLHMGGWYDIFQAGCFKAFTRIQQRGATSLARENQRLVVGPWFHMDQNSTRQGIIDYAPGLSATDYHDIRLAFFDYWMKDIQHEGFALDEPVKLFVTGDNKWRGEKQWPLARAHAVNFYLNDGKSGSIASLNDGALSTALPAKEAKPQSFVYDPANPLPTRGGGCLYMFAFGPDGLPDSGAQDQRPVDAKSLTYTSAPLDKETEITGPVKAVLYASSSAVDTDWVVRLTDVAPDGASVILADGIQRARFRSSGVNPTLIEPGKVYKYEVDLWSVSHVFKPGHRIRVAVTSSNFPRWSRNMNVAEFPEQASTMVKATNTVHLDAAYPSHVVLPVIDR